MTGHKSFHTWRKVQATSGHVLSLSKHSDQGRAASLLPGWAAQGCYSLLSNNCVSDWSNSLNCLQMAFAPSRSSVSLLVEWRMENSRVKENSSKKKCYVKTFSSSCQQTAGIHIWKQDDQIAQYKGVDPDGDHSAH